MSKLSCCYRLVLSSLLAIAWNLVSLQADESDLGDTTRITSNSVVAELGDDDGAWTLEGEVRFEQKDVTLSADQMTVMRKDRKITKIVADGSPVEFQQSLPMSVKAEANQMTYLLDTKVLVLVGKVELQQNGNQLRGARIEYDLQKGELVAGSSDSDETDQIEFVLESIE